MKKNNLTGCKVCGDEFSANSNTCPHCGAKNKKPFYKSGWFITLLVVLLVFVSACTVLRNQEEEGMGSKQGNTATEYVWYVAYGSNINKERFMRYINGCSDQTEPVAEKSYHIPYSIYFAGVSKTWDNKGVAFLDVTKPGSAFGKAYMVTESQFEEIQIAEGSKYTNKVFLGEMEGIPSYTFTTEELHEECNRPSDAYLKTILEGLVDTYPEYTVEEMEEYLNDRADREEP